MYTDKQQADDQTLARYLAWTSDSRRLDLVVKGLMVFCAVLFVIDLFHHRHAYFDFEASRGFYAIAGFAAFTIIVLAAGQLRRVIKRAENYYGRFSTNAETYPSDGLELLEDARFSEDRDNSDSSAGGKSL